VKALLILDPQRGLSLSPGPIGTSSLGGRTFIIEIIGEIRVLNRLSDGREEYNR
jgi:hypothetical protein